MITIYEEIGDNQEKNKKVYEMAADVLKKGGLVAFPTETVYGLGGNGLDPAAAERIYAAKGRPSDNPLIIHIAEVGALEELCEEVPSVAYELAGRYWPGPLTMVMKKKEIVPYTTTGGLETVAVRMPNHQVALDLIRESGVYVAAPSANLSGRPSPTKAEHVKQDMDGRIDMIIDGGAGEIGIESTIVDLTEDIPVILRPGYITREMIAEVAGNAVMDKAVELGVKSDVKPKAPGMKYRHYAPKGEMVVVEGSGREAVEYINKLIEERKKQGICTGVLATSENKGYYKADYVLDVGSRDDDIAISSNLFHMLREFDNLDVRYIVSEAFDKSGVGYAIMNRLLKAAGGKIINLNERQD